MNVYLILLTSDADRENSLLGSDRARGRGEVDVVRVAAHFTLTVGNCNECF